jgi:TetR/AcrR family transcriptional regulator, tetracycline repressor protein
VSSVMPSRTFLDRKTIVSAVLRIVEEHGFAGVTMRELATELSLSPMAVYHHIPSKRELLALAADAVIAQVEIPTPDDGDWAERIMLLHRSYREVHARYPGAITAELQGGFTDEGRRLATCIIEFLQDGGFTGDDTTFAFATLHSYFYGRLGVEEAQRAHPISVSTHENRARTPDPPSDATLDAFRRYAAQPEYDDWGLRVILDGLKRRLEERSGHADAGPAAN